jgi:hypothetical protein
MNKIKKLMVAFVTTLTLSLTGTAATSAAETPKSTGTATSAAETPESCPCFTKAILKSMVTRGISLIGTADDINFSSLLYDLDGYKASVETNPNNGFMCTYGQQITKTSYHEILHNMDINRAKAKSCDRIIKDTIGVE